MSDKETKETSKKPIERSAAYPAISLEEAIEASQVLRKNLGSSTYTREGAATALGYSGLSGSANQKIAACVHFGLLSREGNVYRQSDTADRIFNYTSEAEREETLRQAVQKPALYSRLVTEFNGQGLPAMLENILIRKYGITEKAAKNAASSFKKSMEYAGILVNGVLNAGGEKPSTSSTDQGISEQAGAINSRDQVVPRNETPSSPQVSSNHLPVNIPGTDVTILFPLSYAYELSIGAFKDGITELQKNIKKVHPDDVADEPTPTTEV